jgi:hypothetical protein
VGGEKLSQKAGGTMYMQGTQKHCEYSPKPERQKPEFPLAAGYSLK